LSIKYASGPPGIKTVHTKIEELFWRSMQTKTLTGKVPHVLLSIVLKYCVLISFSSKEIYADHFVLFMSQFVLCSINWAIIHISTNPSTTNQEM
jgi:hypothetical protein